MNWLEKCDVAAKALTQPQRQEILTSFTKGAKVGDVMVEHSRTREEVCGVINMNLVPTLHLPEISR